MAGNGLLLKLALDHHLGRNAGMIRAALPQGIGAPHALIADQNIHQGLLKGVPHVQTARHVRGRQHDAIGRAPAAGREIAALLPVSVKPRLYGLGLVGFVHVK